MKIGKKNLSFAQKRKFRWERFLHFHDHVGARENIFGKIDNLCTGFSIFLVRITRSDAGALLHQHSVAAFRQQLRRRRDERGALFLFFNFFRNADDHSASDKWRVTSDKTKHLTRQSSLVTSHSSSNRANEHP